MRGNIIFDEMGFFSKLSSKRRLDFLKEKKESYADTYNVVNDKAKSSKDENSFRKLYFYTILATLYDRYYTHGFSLNLQQDVIDYIFRLIHYSNDLRTPAWSGAVDDLKGNNVVSELLPRIFTNEILDEWDVVKAEKAKIAKENDEQRAIIEAQISRLNSERSRLYSMFNSMSGFSRTQVSVSIDVIDTRISQCKAKLTSLS